MNSIEMMMDGNPLIPPLPGSAASPPPQAQFGNNTMRPANGIPRFEMVPVRREDGTYVNVEFVDILTPGDPKATPRHKVTDILREMYRPWYDQWRRGLTMSPVGTPLEMWPVMTPAHVATLKAINIFTVEQLSQVADSNLHQIPMGRTLRQQAVTWLATKTDSDAVERQGRENQLLKDAMAMLETQVAALTAMAAEKTQPVQTVQAPPLPSPAEKRGPGRPAKAPETVA